MAKKNTKPTSLSRNDIILGAESDIIRAALEAREQIDTLLDERAEAYRKIAALEAQVDELLGEDDEFPFPEPEEPVATFAPTKKVAKKKPAPKPAPEPKPVEAPQADIDNSDAEADVEQGDEPEGDAPVKD